VVGLALLVTGCGGSAGNSFSTYADAVPDGLVSIADGRAAFAARDILALDGTAADAAVAAAMVLAVVDPAAAGLGGGGACLVHDSFAGETRLLDFLPVAPAATGSPAKTVVPGSVRGLFTLSRQYGRLEWQQLVEPAARLARFGSLVDAGLAGDLAAAAGRLRGDRSARAIYFADGAPLTTGSDIAQLELSATFARLARNGAGDFYAGGVAAALSHGAVAVGLTLERRDLADFQPVWRAPESRQVDALTVESAAAIEQPAAVASVGLTVADAEGLWVACALGMGSPFGSGRMAETTGVFLAGPSAGPWLGGAGPLLLRDGDTVLGIAAGGAGAALPGLVAAAKDGDAPLGYGAAVLCPSGAFSSAACTTSGTGR
jgi:gamma-glutamyltranspeptidase / glutathione hydrolase